jgi:hypothetical protein
MNQKSGFENAMARYGAGILREHYRREIERAIDNAKRTEWDKFWRRQFYRETARIAKALSSHRPKLNGARRW